MKTQELHLSGCESGSVLFERGLAAGANGERDKQSG
jgi:hypothetical protein